MQHNNYYNYLHYHLFEFSFNRRSPVVPAVPFEFGSAVVSSSSLMPALTYLCVLTCSLFWVMKCGKWRLIMKWMNEIVEEGKGQMNLENDWRNEANRE